MGRGEGAARVAARHSMAEVQTELFFFDLDGESGSSIVGRWFDCEAANSCLKKKGQMRSLTERRRHR